MNPAELTRRTPLPRHEAERLLALAMGLTRHKAMSRTTVPGVIVGRYRAFVERRRNGEPLQYIEGVVPFGPIEVAVDPRVLIPRTETEQLFAMLATGPAPSVIVDCCTGSGCLGIALARTFPDAEVHLTDVSEDALEVARSNAVRNTVTLETWCGDLLTALPRSLVGRVDLFVANPPYVRYNELDDLESQIRDHEPRLALDGGQDGLDLIRRIAADLPRFLAPGGRFALEVGHGQADMVAGLLAPLAGVVEQDAFGRDRFVVGSRTE